MPTRTINVAAAQMSCDLAGRERNLAKATDLAERALRQGAELVLFPEMMPGGYTLSESIWDAAEPFEGPTVLWLKTLTGCSRS